MSVPADGSPAPSFVLPDQFSAPTHLNELLLDGPVLVVFFPFAFSGLCTTELDEVRDLADEFERAGLQVVAISCDPMFALRAWADERSYDFPLLSDFWPHGEVSREYGVLDERAGHPVRGTFVIDTDGTVRRSLVNEAGRPRDLLGFAAAGTGRT